MKFHFDEKTYRRTMMMTDKFFKNLDNWSNKMPNISNETAYILYDFSRQSFNWVKQQYSLQAIAYIDELFATPSESKPTSSDERDEKKTD